MLSWLDAVLALHLASVVDPSGAKRRPLQGSARISSRPPAESGRIPMPRDSRGTTMPKSNVCAMKLGAMAVGTQRTRRARDRLLPCRTELREIAERLPELTTTEREEARRHVLRFLREAVAPRTDVEAQPLFPSVGERLRDPLILVSMNYDHLAIRHWMIAIARADVSDVARLRRLLYGLDALVCVQTWKENELFLAMLEASNQPGRTNGARTARAG